MNYYQIDSFSVFDNLEQATNFYLLDLECDSKDIQQFQTNFLLAIKIEDSFNYRYEDLNTKLKALASYANTQNDSALHSMIELIRTERPNFAMINDKEIDNKVLYNRLVNLAGGMYNDFSLSQELKRIISNCITQGIILEDNVYQNKDRKSTRLNSSHH